MGLQAFQQAACSFKLLTMEKAHDKIVGRMNPWLGIWRGRFIRFSARQGRAFPNLIWRVTEAVITGRS